MGLKMKIQFLKNTILVLSLIFTTQAFSQSVNPGKDPNEEIHTAGAASEAGMSACFAGFQSSCPQCCEAQKSQLRLGDNTNPSKVSEGSQSNSSKDGSQ